MSKLYDDVKKQGEQIDDLQKTVTNHTTRIETLETKAKATPPTQTQAMPSEVKVVLPDDIARKSDIEKAVTEITRKCNAGEHPIPQSVTVTVSALDALEKVEYDKAIRKAVKDEIQNTDKKAVENNAILKRIENRQNSSDNEIALRNKLNAFKIGFVINVVVFIAFGVMFLHQDNEIEHLKRVEWLYRWSRIGRTDTEEYQDFERRMLDGKKEEREGMKTKIFNMERNSPQFLYFRPVDDWKPEPPESPKSEETEQSKPKAESKPKPLPHEKRSRLTPGEIEAIKRVRANPHIPEDAKPPLPDGYE
ncbi:hypothetical protein E7747_03015 [Duncaniella dubosii]|uniref:Uncharacterized protein n=1 Tax=Duncaniella dubosii TaxID=2518971 RepID=A0A4P7W0T7_9BACT|nr:hypothetical protein [Duncaniella dubosii]QCD41367.1 hypothetical protein E7747_03015 [Duncaniella dubosii]